jgi:hypothetical protein
LPPELSFEPAVDPVPRVDPLLPDDPRGTARPVADPPPRRWSSPSARLGRDGAARGGSYEPADPAEPLDDDEPDELEGLEDEGADDSPPPRG